MQIAAGRVAAQCPPLGAVGFPRRQAERELKQNGQMTEVESARRRQVTLAQLVVACHQGIRGQRKLELRRPQKLPERVRLVGPVESRWTWRVMVDAVLAALVIVE